MAGKIHRGVNNGRSPPMFVISGQNYHSIGSLVSLGTDKPKFAQLYIYDTDHEVDNRLALFRSLSEVTLVERELVIDIHAMLDSNNPLSKSFRYARDRFKSTPSTDIKLRLIKRRDMDGRRYNLPSVSEVAALIVGDIDHETADRDIIIETHNRYLKRIDVNHPMYLSLQYPLLFPYGEDGFKNDIFISDDVVRKKRLKRETISLREFLAYRIQIRADESYLILKSRRLFQQFLVDSYTMVESERLQYHRLNQDKFRAHQLKGLHECIVQGEESAAKAGQRIILPGTYTGGPQYMFNNCNDAFSICRYAGYPSYFITMTCNLEWTEITDFVQQHGLKAVDRPDVMCRVFKLKLDEILKDLKNGVVFGKCRTNVSIVEFQKRGLPHCHILLFIHISDKPRSADDFDRHILAEIPDRSRNPKLYALVEKFMVHGPCGVQNLKSPCMVDGRCSKYYPRSFHDRSVIDEAGYPKYMRREDGCTICKRNVVLDNRYVVPYNPALLRKFGCHINVEYTCQTSAVKYLFKYVHKGNDRVTAALFGKHGTDINQGPVDEIQNYYDCRYISACEAAWRIFAYEVQFKEHNVIRLPFHLPDDQSVIFLDSEPLHSVISRSVHQTTMFLSWLLANRKYGFGGNLTYHEYPSVFVWDKDNYEWRPRKQGHVICRLSHVPFGFGEDYYLKLLLNVQKGCCSYEDIRTFNVRVFVTFKECCLAMGLLQDDNEFINVITDANTWASSPYLRRLFVVLLTSNNIGRPCDVWNKCWRYFADDIVHSLSRAGFECDDINISDDELHTIALAKIEELLVENGRSLDNYADMPTVDFSILTKLRSMVGNEIECEDVQSTRVEAMSLVGQLNVDQRAMFDRVIMASNCTDGGFFFVNGCGGAGKTFLWKALTMHVRSTGGNVLCVASSEIVALLLPNGRTAHSQFKIPINVNEDSICNIKPRSPLAKIIEKAKL